MSRGISASSRYHLLIYFHNNNQIHNLLNQPEIDLLHESVRVHLNNY